MRTEVVNKNNKGISFAKVAAILYILASLVFLATVWFVGVLPLKYEIALSAIVVVFGLIISMLLLRKGRGAMGIFLGIVAVLLAIILAMCSYYLIGTGNFFDKIANVKDTTDFYVVARADSEIDSEDGLSGKTVTMPVHTDIIYESAANQLKDLADVEVEVTGESLDLCKELIDGSRELIFINSAYYDIATEEIDGFDEEAVKVIARISLNNEPVEDTKKEAENGKAFNLYITGIDTSGSISKVSRSDVNMIVTVNPETKQILLTSIPRDYYVRLAVVGQMDKLTHAGLMGPDATVQTVEDLMGIDINYYLKVNFSTVTNLVDILGGIDVESEYAFVSRKGHYQFVQGMNHMNGDMALCFARERYAFASGDRQRGKNQQAVIKAIIDKITSSPAILLKYNDILRSLDDNMQTNMEADKIKELVKMQLDDMSKWDITTVSLDGSGMSTTTYFCPNISVYVMVPYQNTIDEARTQINEILNNTKED